jgi:hypothetical protein
MRDAIRVAIAAVAIVSGAAAAQTPAEVDGLLARIGERLAVYYKVAQNVMCIEKYTVQPIDWTLSPQGFARITESELRVEPDAEDGDGSAEAKFVRVIRKTNGRVPREKDKKDPYGCTDPNPLTPEPLAFLLPAHRSDYAFSLAGRGKGKEAELLLIDYRSIGSGPKAELVESGKGLENCYEGKGTIPTKGRVWVHAETFDVVRIEEHLTGPVDFRISDSLRRKRNLDNQMVMERADTTIHFRRVAFDDPAEVMLLPESIEELHVWHGGMQSTRRRQQFTDYRRFLTGARLVK